MTAPTLDRCLFHELLCHHDRWLIEPSLNDIRTFLSGASRVMSASSRELLLWPIYGSLFTQRHFTELMDQVMASQRIEDVARRRDHDARYCDTLRAMLEEDFARGLPEALTHPVRIGMHAMLFPPPEYQDGPDPMTEERAWKAFARRPGMWLGYPASGAAFYAFLNGAHRGAAWLGGPNIPRIERMFTAINQRSMALYGEERTIYQTHGHGQLAPLFEIAGLPLCPSPQR